MQLYNVFSFLLITTLSLNYFFEESLPEPLFSAILRAVFVVDIVCIVQPQGMMTACMQVDLTVSCAQFMS